MTGRFGALTLLLPCSALFFLFAFAPSLAFAAELGQGASYFDSHEFSTQVNVTRLTLTPNPIYTSTTGDFAITMNNSGNVPANASASVKIYNSLDALFDSFNYSYTSVAPDSQVTLLKSWSSGSLAVGAYYANATATWENGANSSNTYRLDFTVISVPVQGTGGGSGGSSGGGGFGQIPQTVLPVPLPPIITPKKGDIEFVATTVLKEINAGSDALESFVLRNAGSGQRTVSIALTGIPSEWAQIVPTETILLPGEERVVNFAVSVPENAIPGDYLVQIRVGDHDSQSTEFSIVRVKNGIGSFEEPLATKTIRINRATRETTVSFSLRNQRATTANVILVKEEIPENFIFDRSGIKFKDKPGQIVSGERAEIVWEFSNVQSGELDTVSYTIPLVSEDYAQYARWTVGQISVLEKIEAPSDYLKIEGISVAQLFEGGEGEVTALVFYGGLEPLAVKATLSIPGGFRVSPATSSLTLSPRSATEVKFKLAAPQGSAGSHLLTLTLSSEGAYVSKSSTVIVDSPVVAVALSSPSFQFLLAGLLVVAAILAVAARRTRKERSRVREIDMESRETYMHQIKRELDKK